MIKLAGIVTLYKPDKEVTKSTSKELVQCAKMVNKLDNKMMILNT